MTNKTKSETDDSPFAGCILHEKAKSGEWFDYSYPQSGLPKMRVKSALVCSLFWDGYSQQKKSSKNNGL